MGEGSEREALLALSQRKLNALSAAGGCYIDADQRYRFVNRAFLDWTGKPQAEVHRARDRRSRRAASSISSINAYVEAALAGERVSFERQLSSVPSATRSGSASTTTPDRGPRGDVRGLLATYTDVDSIKRLELEAGEREHRLRLVTDSVGSADLLLRPRRCGCASPTSRTASTSA